MFQDLVGAMEIDALRAFALELLRRQPAAFADVVNGVLQVGNPPHAQQPGPDPQPDPQPDNRPEWCRCGHCAEMPTQLENKCCTERRQRQCVTQTDLFPQLLLDGNMLEIAMRYREDFLVENAVRNNENFRHAAYRQYILWQHGHCT